jgi:CHAT domain-containing protein
LEQDEVRLMASRRALLDLEETAALSSVATLQAQLKTQQRVLVAYYIDGADRAYRAPMSHAFIVTPNTFRTVPLPLNADTLGARLAAVSPLLGDGAERVSINAVNFDLAALHRLHEALFAPVADGLPAGWPVTIIPDGPLFRLPFSMLVTEPVQGRAYSRVPYLIRERPLSMELSATLIGDTTRATDRFALDIAALGRTRFEAVPSLPPALRARLDSTGSLPALPGVERELDAVRERFARRQVLLDERATEDRLRTLQSQTKILHLASHALIHPSDPLANLFVLSPARSTGAQHDGLLFVHELGAQFTPVPLVVLSGCRTARGLMRAGEGPKGLQYAFRSTGAKSTLSTLWDAEDQATVALTRSFYDHLIDGHPKDVALQQAQLDLIERFPNRASPFFWAGAVLYGTPHSLSLQPASLVPLLPVAAGGAILLLVALGFGYSRYRRH